jgi:hypothetical protein
MSDTTLKFGSNLAISSSEKVRICRQIFSKKIISLLSNISLKKNTDNVLVVHFFAGKSIYRGHCMIANSLVVLYCRELKELRSTLRKVSLKTKTLAIRPLGQCRVLEVHHI